MAQILKILKNAPKSFRNWVKPIMGTKKWHFRENFLSPFFQTKKLGKISKKWKILKIAKNGPNFKNFEKCPQIVQKLGKTNYGH